MRIVVLGYVVRGPLGGMAWHHLQYVVGLQRLGHEVLFLEDSEDYPCCYDPSRNLTDADPTFGLGFAQEAFGRLGLPGAWAYWDQPTQRWLGPGAERAAAFCRRAEVVLNVSGVNPLRPWLEHVPVRALIDTDPVFTQVRNLTDDWFRQRTDRHTHFLTFGENIGRPGCTIPDDGRRWKPTRQPVVGDLWPVAPPRPEANWTTIMQWDSYAQRAYAGVTYGMKSASFDPYLDLPRRIPGAGFLLALGTCAKSAELASRGWRLANPLEVTRTPWTYQDFIAASKGEWSVAKQGYVAARSGWFSERSCAYLASGRPVVVQDTGLATLFPVGEGVLTFATPDQAVAAIEEVQRRYDLHCRRARAWVAAHFSAERVLTRLLDDLRP